MKHKSKALLVLISIGVIGMATTQAIAADRWVHGSVCKPMERNAAGSTSWLGFNEYGAHNKDANAAHAVICPVSTDGAGAASVTVSVYDRATFDSVAVQWCSVDPNGGSALCSQAASGTLATGYQTLVLPDPGIKAVRFVTVKLPANATGVASHVVSILRS